MKVVILNTSERTGGAAVAAGRLMNALRKAGTSVRMLVRDKQTADPDVSTVSTSYVKRKLGFLRFAWERLVIYACNRFSRKNLFQVSIADTGADVSRLAVVKEADVIHLHWINQGFLSLEDIRRLLATGKPVVWTLHDVWPATGICHYPGACTRYKEVCRNCPMLVSHPFCDLAKATFRKKLSLDFSNVTFVGCSRWITEKARQSALLEKADFHAIPNPIDTTVFKRIDKAEARRKYQLPPDHFLLLFAAAKVSDTRKGAVFLAEACRRLQSAGMNTFDIVVLGNSSEELAGLFPCRVHSLGYVSDAASIAAAYSCADLFIIPSLEDNLPNTVMEAMACGTPCVGFRTGGIPEMIDHRVNGYVAAYKDAGDLADGIAWGLHYPDAAALSDACLAKVASHYSEAVVAEKYNSLYQHVVAKKKLCDNRSSLS